MSDDLTQNDELLSAYLDDELAPGERARVEARLASDPAARRLLDELRAVSQSVQGLPRESLPDDLSETVLRRAEKAMLTPASISRAEDGPADGKRSTIELLRKIPVGRSRRAWIWAGTAIAAGLLIMIFEREPGQDADLPSEVAHKGSGIDHPLPPLEFRAVDKPAAAPPIADSSGEVESAPRRDAVSARESRELEGLGRASTVASLPESGAETDRFAGGRSDAGSAGIAGDEMGQPDSAEEATSESTAGVDLLVVTVSAKPEAIERKLIDAVLARHGIVVEDSTEDAADSNVSADGSTESRVRTELALEPSREPQSFGFRWSGSGSSDDERSEVRQPMDVVLVEAQPAQIYGCLSELDADRANYLGIDVDDQLTETRSNAASAHDWKQYSRGVVPSKQKVQVAADNNLYVEADGRQIALDADRARSRIAGEVFADAKTVESPTAELFGHDGSNAYGRALRVRQQNLEADDGPRGGTGENSGTELLSGAPPVAGYDAARTYDTQTWGYARRGMQKLATKAETLQMLILLCPTEEPAEPGTSPAASDSLR